VDGGSADRPVSPVPPGRIRPGSIATRLSRTLHG
jgi:hypothetical protein